MSRATSRGRRLIDAVVLGMPAVGAVCRKVAVARFCRTLSALFGSGVPILEGLAITARVTGNVVVEEAVLSTRLAVERGESMSGPLRATGVFPATVVQMIHVGESTGALDAMLAKVADICEEDVDASVAGLLTLLEPILIALLGVVVGGIVVAMYLPIFDLIGRLAG
jgi:type IV pilus assembly protein PilC